VLLQAVLSLPFIRPGVSHLIFLTLRRQHPGMFGSFLGSLISALKTRRSLALENLALRQQLAVLHCSVKRLRLSDVGRGFWVLLRRIWIHRFFDRRELAEDAGAIHGRDHDSAW